MTDFDIRQPISQAAVEAAIRALAATRLKTKSDSMVRAFLAFKAIHRVAREKVDTPLIRQAVESLFTVLPTPEGVSETKYRGTLALRGTGGRPTWLRNDSYRGSFLDYVGPTSPGRFMFENNDWREPMRADAIARVTETIDAKGYAWPPADALAAIAVRNESLDPTLEWDDITKLAQERFGLSEDEWNAVTSPAALDVGPFDGEPWDSAHLSAELRPAGEEKAAASEREIEELPPQVASQVERVLDALAKYGSGAIVALAGVPGTSKSYIARIAARTFASAGCLCEIQFSPGYTYEEFMEGPRYREGMAVEVVPGAFLELNARALEDPGRQYVFLVEELTRADLSRVLGELLTYVEYRNENDLFTTMYRRNEPTRIAPNVAVLATYNPADNSAISIDAAMIRRMRILDFPPNMELLTEMLSDNGVEQHVIDELVDMFRACRDVAGDRFEDTMPFGHALFAHVESERDLHNLWHETIKRILIRPRVPRHELYDAIIEHYPWHESPDKTVVPPSARVAGPAEGAGP